MLKGPCVAGMGLGPLRGAAALLHSLLPATWTAQIELLDARLSLVLAQRLWIGECYLG